MATLGLCCLLLCFYSLMWGAETSNEWLVSVMVSFFQDAIVMQPMKVLLVASILSILVKKATGAGKGHGGRRSEKTQQEKLLLLIKQSSTGHASLEAVLFKLDVKWWSSCFSEYLLLLWWLSVMATEELRDLWSLSLWTILFQTFRKVRLTRLTTCAPKTIFSSLFPEANTWHLVISPLHKLKLLSGTNVLVK